MWRRVWPTIHGSDLNGTGVRRFSHGAGTSVPCRFSLGREHVVVHSYDHRDENYGVVEKVQLDAGNPKLRDAGRNGGPEKIATGDGLPLKKRVLDVVPELYSESDHPPLVRPPLKPFAEAPDAYEHH
jgi:hypothetical protein